MSILRRPRGPVRGSRILPPPAHAALCHGLLHGLIEPLRVGGEGVDPGVGVREDLLQDVPRLCLHAVLACVFGDVYHAPQLPDVAVHYLSQFFRSVLVPDSGLQLQDQARRLRRPVVEDLVVRDLPRRHPQVVRLDDDPVSGVDAADQPGAVRALDLDTADHECGLQARLFPHPVRRGPKVLVPGALRHDPQRLRVRSSLKPQVPAAYLLSP